MGTTAADYAANIGATCTDCRYEYKSAVPGTWFSLPGSLCLVLVLIVLVGWVRSPYILIIVSTLRTSVRPK